MTRFALVFLLCTMNEVPWHTLGQMHVEEERTAEEYRKEQKASCRIHMQAQNKNITCVKHESDFICCWVPLENSKNAQYSVNMTSTHRTTNKSKSYDGETEDNFYFFKSPGFNDRVTVSVKRLSSSTKMWQISIDKLSKIEKYDPPKLERSGVSWKDYRPVTYGINLTCEFQYLQEAPRMKKEWNITVDSESVYYGNNIVDVPDVKPCVSYTISARCADKDRMSPWSEWSPSITTSLPLSESSISLSSWRRMLKPDEKGIRKVYFMWKGPPLACHVVDEYKLYVDSNFTQRLDPSQNQTPIFLTSAAHELTIAAYKEGFMLRNDSVLIPDVAELNGNSPDQLVQATSVDGQVLVSWAEPLYPASSYMVVWYTNQRVIDPKFNWLQTQETNISFLGVPHTLYTVIITPLNGTIPGSDSVIHVYAKEGEPAKVTKVKVADIDNTWARVEWEAVGPDQCCGFVLNYTVFCEATSTEQPVLNITVKSQKDQPGKRYYVTLKDLQPNQEYRVYVMASSVAGSSKGGSNVFRTKQFGRRFIMILVFTGIGGLLLLSIALSIFILLVRIRYFKVPNPGLSSLGKWTQEASLKSSSPWAIIQPRDENVACDISTLEQILLSPSDSGETHLSAPQVHTDYDYESTAQGRGGTRATNSPPPAIALATGVQISAGFRDTPVIESNPNKPCLEQALAYISVETGQALASAVGTHGSSLENKTTELEPNREQSISTTVLSYMTVEQCQSNKIFKPAQLNNITEQQI